MKNIFTFLFIFFALSVYAQTDGDQLFQIDILHEIRFENGGQAFSGAYIPVKAIIDGEEIDSVGVRIKGGYSTSEDKKPLKIDFNRYREDQEYDGLKKVNLHNANFDESMQREAIVYEIMRKSGLKAPRTAFTKVYLNDEFMGVYILVDQIDKTFLHNHFAGKDGVLYKTYGSDFEVISDEGDFSALNELTATINNFNGEELRDTLDEILDSRALLLHIVAQNILNVVDNLITNSSNNLVLYEEPVSGQLYFIPWDMNLGFFTGANFPPDFTPANAVAAKMLTVPTYLEEYYSLYCEMLNYNYTEERLFGLLDDRKALIEEFVAIDPYIEFSISDFENEQIVVKNWITNRINQLEIQLEALGITCENIESPIDYQDITINEFMASNNEFSGISDPAGDFPDWIELYNNTDEEISLDGFYLSDDTDFRKHWAFPKETVIPAHDYLIVWTDRDVNEEGLHTDFNLAKNSGDIFLSYKDFTVIDAVSYETQTTNISLARIPNGTGDFIAQNPTFNANNGVVSRLNFNHPDLNWMVYPNPTNGFIQIRLPEHIESSVFRIAVSDVYGKILQEESITSFRLKGLSSGVYTIQLHVEDRIWTKKIVKFSKN